ncbi:MAG: Crp/Fnr family transcriptional regulator [Lewinellaceae bacterium]|nr:Crp/Fnr family transcriptional regulator [Lewinellaceae bacterium]
MLTDPALLRRLIAENEVKILPPNQVIQDFHKYFRNIPIVLRGYVKVLGEDDKNNEILLYYIKPGESCVMSILGAMNGGASKIKAVTVDETEIIFIRPEKAATLVKESPAWAEFIFQLYQTRFEELLQVVTDVHFKNTDDRIVELLREKARMFGSRVIEITHQQIAAEIGTTREVVTRILRKLEKDDVLRTGRGKIRLV